MSLRLVATPDDPNRAAIAYGPVILAGEMGNEGIVPPAPYSQYPWGKDWNTPYDFRIPGNLKHSINTGGSPVTEWVRPADEKQPLTFVLTDGNETDKVKLVPYYRLHHQRYVIYWDLK